MAVIQQDKEVKIRQLEDCLRFAEVMQSHVEDTSVTEESSARRPHANTNVIINRAREVFKANKLKDNDLVDPSIALEAIQKYCKVDLGMENAQLNELMSNM